MERPDTWRNRRVACADGPSHSVALSGDGRWVAYVSSARRLLPGQTLSGRGQIYLEDTATGARQLVSAGPDGREGNGHSLHPAIDVSGSHVVYETTASDLAGMCASSRRIGHATCVDDINLVADIVHWTRATGVVRRVTPDDEDIWLDPSVLPTVSGDGRHVGFLSRHPATHSTDEARSTCS